MSDPLAAIDDWPVPHAAAAVVGPSGVVATRGPVERSFRLASVTKPLTALAVLVAVEEEAVSLADAADPSLPDATLRHLLAHASGCAAEERRLAYPPGSRRVYSNAGFELAAEHVERGADLPFASYLAEAVCAPMSMDATELTGSPASGAVSCVRDLARVVQELLSSTGLLSAPMRADLASVQFPGLRGVLPGYGGQDPNDWGLGVEIRGHKSPHWTGTGNSARAFGHFGQSGTLLWVDPDAALGLVALTDRDFGDWAKSTWPALADAVLERYRSSGGPTVEP